jgi:hypothetical protein
MTFTNHSTALPRLIPEREIGAVLKLFNNSTYVWRIVHELNLLCITTKQTTNESVKPYEFTKTVCFFPSSNVYSYWEIAKRAQFNILFHKNTLLFLSSKLKYFLNIKVKCSHFGILIDKNDN